MAEFLLCWGGGGGGGGVNWKLMCLTKQASYFGLFILQDLDTINYIPTYQGNVTFAQGMSKYGKYRFTRINITTINSKVNLVYFSEFKYNKTKMFKQGNIEDNNEKFYKGMNTINIFIYNYYTNLSADHLYSGELC